VVIEKEPELPAEVAEPAPAAGPHAVVADHFAAYVFDDVNLKFEDLAHARDAAARQIRENSSAAQRVAIYTTSGLVMQEFTSDQALLESAIARLRPSAMGSIGGFRDCPELTPYVSDLIINKNDPTALSAAVQETLLCAMLPSMAGAQTSAESMVRAKAQEVLSESEHRNRNILLTLRNVVRRISGMPGQRHVIFVSPGFLLPEIQDDLMELINRAVRGNVIVSALDARGLWTPPGYTADAPSSIGGPMVQTAKLRYAMESARVDSDVLHEVADGTGGTLFENNNDLLEGFRRLASAPEFIYVLGFNPSSLKFNGGYHSIKVTLKLPSGRTVQARRGYYAPKHEVALADQAHEEIEDALFSREVQRELPLDIRTQFFKSSEEDATITVLARVDVRRLRFRPAEGRQNNTVTVVTALFDPDGNFKQAIAKQIELKLKDTTLNARPALPFTLKIPFQVKVGSYVVRVVARDTEGHMLAADNGVVEIH
jgi:VWFA-related protein